MAVLTKAQIAALSTEQRLALTDELWDGLEPPSMEESVEAEHRRIVGDRLANYDPSSDELLTLNEVSKRLRDR